MTASMGVAHGMEQRQTLEGRGADVHGAAVIICAPLGREAQQEGQAVELARAHAAAGRAALRALCMP